MVPARSHKVILFADSDVGFEIVKFAVSNFPANLSAVVVTDNQNDIAKYVRASGVSVRILVWRSPDALSFMSSLRQIAADIVLLTWWPFIAKEELACGQVVTLNFHPSLLPHNRGKNPNFWSLVDEEPFGVSIHHVVLEIDAGPIAFQREIPYDWSDTGGSLYKKGLTEIVDLFKANYKRILALDIPCDQQDLRAGSFHWARELDPKSQIDLDAPTTARQLFNLLRARTFPPHRSCQFTDADKTYDVKIEITPTKSS